MHRRYSVMLFVFLTLLPSVPSFVYASPVHLTSLTDSMKGPVRVALDTQGNLYVSDTLRNSLLIYNRKGEYLKSLNIPGPIGVAIDPAGRIYIGSEGRQRVDVYNPDLSFSYSLRTGQGENAKIAKPNSIAIDAAGRIYVVDSINDTVRVFDPSGTLAFSFGSTGNTDGLFNKPTAVAISDAAGEVYVTDLQVTQTSSGLINGARIQVFDKNGAFKRSFGQYGINVGQIATPVDIAVDRTGTLYAVDSFQRVVHIIDPADGASLGGIYDLNKPFETPQGVAIGRDNLVYVTSYAGKSVEVYGLDGYTKMTTSPTAITFEGRQLGPNPGLQAAMITNSGSDVLNWTAVADKDNKSWITLDAAEGSTKPGSSSTLLIGVNLQNLAVGTYKGVVTVTPQFGPAGTVLVTLTVLRAPTVSFSRDGLTFTAKEGTKPYPVSVALQNTEALSWTITSDSPWLGIDPAAGNKAGPVSVAVNTSALAPGEYKGHATIQAPGAVGSAMAVSLTIIDPSKTKVTSKKNIITVKGPGPQNTALIKTYKADGTSAGLELTAFDDEFFYGANITAADIDGDGVAELIVGAGPGPNNPALVRIFKADGKQLLEFTPFDSRDSRYGVNVAAADLNGDGQAELIVAPGPGPNNPATVKVYAYNKDTNTMIPTGIEFTAFGYSYGANIAVADTEGDGLPELITAPGPGPQNPAEVKIWKVDTTKGMGNWTATESSRITLDGRYGANIAAGDMDGDGKDELIAGAGPDPTVKAEVSIFTADGIEQKRFTAFDTYKYGVNVAAADLDGDGVAEIVTGAGPDPSPPAPKAQANNNRRTFRLGFIKFSMKRSNSDSAPPAEQTVKIFNASGERKYTLKPYEDTAYGVKAATGDLGL